MISELYRTRDVSEKNNREKNSLKKKSFPRINMFKDRNFPTDCNKKSELKKCRIERY